PDVERPLDPLRRLSLRDAANPRRGRPLAQVDRERADDGRGEDGDGEPDRARSVADGAVRAEAAEQVHFSTTSRAPASTDAPSRACISATTPSPGARSSFSIFIASITTSGWRDRTASPGAACTRTILPGIGAAIRCGPPP